MTNTKHLPERLKELRKKHHFSQIHVAEQLNVSRQAISQWENGKAIPDLDNLILLARMYNISLDQLVNDTSVSLDSSSNPASNSDKYLSSIEMIGISVVLILSAQFPIASLFVSVFIALWMKKNNRNYTLIYALCFICFIIGSYNTFIFVTNLNPNYGVPTIENA